MLSIVNGQLSRRMINDLKFAALFYKRVLLFDGYLHCYGPLSAHLDQMRMRPASQSNDTVCTFLRNGILVPVIRQPSPTRTVSTIAENFIDGAAGVKPGEFMILSSKDGRG